MTYSKKISQMKMTILYEYVALTYAIFISEDSDIDSLEFLTVSFSPFCSKSDQKLCKFKVHF